MWLKSDFSHVSHLKGTLSENLEHLKDIDICKKLHECRFWIRFIHSKIEKHKFFQQVSNYTPHYIDYNTAKIVLAYNDTVK